MPFSVVVFPFPSGSRRENGCGSMWIRIQSSELKSNGSFTDWIFKKIITVFFHKNLSTHVDLGIFSQWPAEPHEQFTLIGWDPPGFGSSRPPERSFDNCFATDAKLAVKLMVSLGFTKFSLLGWSDGGITALIAAARSLVYRYPVADPDSSGSELNFWILMKTCIEARPLVFSENCHQKVQDICFIQK